MVDHDGPLALHQPLLRAHARAAPTSRPASTPSAACIPTTPSARASRVLRAAATGKPRELALRLVDRDGRVRQYKTRVQAVARTSALAAQRLLLVSQDVTDLRESEERLLLAAHASRA